MVVVVVVVVVDVGWLGVIDDDVETKWRGTGLGVLLGDIDAPEFFVACRFFFCGGGGLGTSLSIFIWFVAAKDAEAAAALFSATKERYFCK